MGTISPNPYYTDEIAKECMDTIFIPTINAMVAEGRPFKGCLYFGLMITPNGPKVIEYNARFGDPEAQVVLSTHPRIMAKTLSIFARQLLTKNLLTSTLNGTTVRLPA